MNWKLVIESLRKSADDYKAMRTAIPTSARVFVIEAIANALEYGRDKREG